MTITTPNDLISDELIPGFAERHEQTIVMDMTTWGTYLPGEPFRTSVLKELRPGLLKFKFLNLRVTPSYSSVACDVTHHLSQQRLCAQALLFTWPPLSLIVTCKAGREGLLLSHLVGEKTGSETRSSFPQDPLWGRSTCDSKLQAGALRPPAFSLLISQYWSLVWSLLPTDPPTWLP